MGVSGSSIRKYTYSVAKPEQKMGNSVKAGIKEPDTQNEHKEEEMEETKELKQIKAKLIKAFGNGGGNQLTDLAEKLIDKEKTKQEYFSHLLMQTETARRVISDDQDTFPGGFPNQSTRADSEQRMVEHIRMLEVKLILHELNDTNLVQTVAGFAHKFVSSFTFGPFHASILIGDVLLEWRPNSLVIPRRIKAVHDGDNRAVLFANLHETSFDSHLPSVPLQYEEGVNQETIASSFEKIKDITREKEYLINELVDVVVRYNSKMTYGIFTNNCQHFVRDVLTVLGITDPEKAFRGRIKQHAELVIARHRKEATVEFNSHQELDRHIKETKIEKMSRDDLEFAYCHYLLFHAWGKKFPFEGAWTCNRDECQADAIAKLVQ